MSAPLPLDESARLDVLRSYRILDTPAEPAFDRITALAAQLLDMPIALISFVDEQRTWFKSRHGLVTEQVDRANSICPHAVLTDAVMVVEDLAADPRFRHCDAVAGPPGLRCYVGAPLKVAGGHRLGTLCVLDTRPRGPWPLERLQLLADLAAVAVDELELRLKARLAQESQELLASVFGAAAIGITVTDESGRFVAVNRAYCRLVDYSTDELIGQPFTIVLPEETRAEAERIHAAFIDRAQSGPVEWRLRSKRGTAIDVHLSSARLLRQDGQRFRVTTLSDVTALKQLEEQARALHKMEAVERLAGGSAHTFNNLLTIITGYSQLLRNELPAGGALHGFADEIFQASERAAAMTAKLLAFSQRRPARLQPLELNGLLEQLRPTVRQCLGPSIELVTQCQAGLPRVLADPDHLEQVIRIVATNALEAMPGGGVLKIRSALCHDPRPELPPGAYALLEFHDNGPGMDPAAEMHLFEPFFTTKGIGKGTGLATAYGMVRQCGGTVAVSSEPGAGTMVAVYLPLAP